MNSYYEALKLLAELAGEQVEDTYSVVSYALGFIPFKNGKNMVADVGTQFSDIARWLIDEGEKNFNRSLNEELSKGKEQV